MVKSIADDHTARSVRRPPFGAVLPAAVALCMTTAVTLTSAQPLPQPRRIGFLGMDSAMQEQRFAAFRDEMRKQGFTDGANLAIETRWAEGHFDRLPVLATELVATKIEVLVTAAPPAVRAAMAAATSIPVVAIVHDPVGMRFVTSYAHPGGRLTGVAFQDSELSAKRLELMSELVPGLKRLAIVWNREGGGDEALRTVEQTARSLKIETRAFEVEGPAAIVAAVAASRSWGAQGLLQLASPVITFNRRILIESLASNQMPAVCEMRLYVQEGCLMTYSADLDEMFRSLARPTARILNGARASDLPIEQPSQFQFVINKKTADALALKIPRSLQIQMTEPFL
jgi:putative tryptophan/tyrosine transport system substrate-binding protein